ncbi:trehalase family glycosidase [uncultured Odoribacter sp.]|uniref:MGH1-like glycoside hydrolase domain-containing protein n=1 Tax=uncultured Odoribacter sp. TaxID=876416 RepID=UPI00261FCF31|nr:trehalase family glycosidase [uncultured Odoribacter sp.]
MYKILWIGIVIFCFVNCKPGKITEPEKAFAYPDILNITYTPDQMKGGKGWFTDYGAWMGFTLPEANKFTNGFCGPFDLDNRKWISRSLVQVGYVENGKIMPPDVFRPDSLVYFPGQLYMKSSLSDVSVSQRLFFTDKNHALLVCQSNRELDWFFEGNIWGDENKSEVINRSVVIYLPGGEVVGVTFEKEAEVMLTSSVYKTSFSTPANRQTVVLSFFNQKEELPAGLKKAETLLEQSGLELKQHTQRWNSYLKKVLREDMPESYNRIAVKAMVTLLSNWRSSKGDLLHDGMVPSHAVGYFVGFWAWDTWKQAVATVHFEPELAKNQIRSMFDYQDEAGMIADCIYSNKRENNYRDSKPPLAAWSVYEVCKETADTAFVREMYPKLLKYYRWWFRYRDHDGNGICEFGSTDGTEEAAKWESGMDNAVRFDEAKMVKNGEDAWSFNQESVDLNAYLCYEYRLLQQMADLIGEKFEEPDRTEVIRTYFFDSQNGYFFDRILKGDFVRVEGPEGWTPLWTEIATTEQAGKVMKIIADTNKFSTYIPFPTLAADHPKFLPGGYWRGPIWLDQVYFGISGIRKYGYHEEADRYTDQVFTRLKGLSGKAPIHENYDTHDGSVLKAPHFSWSAAHLLMMYWEYGKE